MKRGRVFFARTLTLGRFRLILKVAAQGRCTETECAYNNSWCPNGCYEAVYEDLSIGA